MPSIRAVLSGKVPDQALDYCVHLWHEAPFDFALSQQRVSKLGDFRYDPSTGVHRVTVNVDLNPYQFLITFIHEVAHRRVHDPKRRLKPHGPHWKSEFKRLLLPVMNDQVFPDKVLRPLARHMKNPKASTVNDHALYSAIGEFDKNAKQLRIIDLPVGEQFFFKSRSFELLEKKRKRALCLDIRDGKKYLISLIAPIESN